MPPLASPHSPVDLHALRHIVNTVPGDLHIGHDGSPGRLFWVVSIEGALKFVQDHGMDVFLDDARGVCPPVGCGTPLDELDADDVLQLASQIRAASYEGRVNYKAITDLKSAARITMAAIHEDVWAAIDLGVTDKILEFSDGKLTTVF